MGSGPWCPALGRQNTSRPAISVHAISRVSGARNPDYQSVYVFDNDHPCVGADAPQAARAAPGIYRNAPATGVARVVCYTPKHNTTLAELPVECKSPTLLEAWRDQIPRARRAARHPARADLREQGRSGRRLESASARADLRDEFRLQDHRDRSRGRSALLSRSTAACSSRTSSAPSWTMAVAFSSRTRPQWSFVPYFARYAYECYVAPKDDARQPRDDVGERASRTWPWR